MAITQETDLLLVTHELQRVIMRAVEGPRLIEIDGVQYAPTFQNIIDALANVRRQYLERKAAIPAMLVHPAPKCKGGRY